MAHTINKVELLGRVGTDPEMQYTPGGTAVTKLRLATDRRRQNGETEADWHNIVVWGKTAEAVNQYVGKGQRVYVAGRLVRNSWETEDGQHRHLTEVVFLDNRTPTPASAERKNHGAASHYRGGPATCSNR